MKALMVTGVLSLLVASISICAISGWSNSYASTTSVATPANSGKPASELVLSNGPNTTAAENSSNSWTHSAARASRDGEGATQKGYNRVSRDIKDITLEGKVQAVLHENKLTRDSDVHVTAENGIVTLTGNVPSEQNAHRVQAVVASVDGVKAVNNGLKYPHGRGAVTPPDADSIGVAHPAYSDTAPAEEAPLH